MAMAILTRWPLGGVCDKNFIKVFKKKVVDERYDGDYTKNFGLSDDNVALLRRQIDGILKPVIRAGEEFNLDKVFERFNVILRKV